MASETTTHRYVRRCLAGLPKTTSEGLVITSGRYPSEQFDTLQSSRLTDFSTVFFFECAAAVPSNGGHIYWEWPAKRIGWSSVELCEFRAKKKSCGRELFMAACDSCFFAKKENNLLEHHRWQFLTSDPRFNEYTSLPVSRKSRTRGNEHMKARESIQFH